MLQFTRLRLVGFKSFVEPTDMMIEPGLTGIVGPNGCGKSNLVEALRWVMGESASRALRAGEMDDVIFAGTAERPGRGFAEVVIAIDNSARCAPPPFADEPELNVSRRIDRGRGSQYRINGREVRARDVQLLFSDHTAGARSAAMVTQGQVAQLIAAKAVDRRALLEEAAGVSGLAARRNEAEGRLAAAESNLTRVDDVIAALATQRRSLREQAVHAARYRELSAAIRRAEAASFRRQWRAAEAAVRTTEAGMAAAQAHVVAASAEAASAAVRQAEAAATVTDLRQRAARVSEALFAAIRQCDQLDAEDAMLSREIATLSARHQQLSQDLAREQALAADADAARDRLLAERERLLIDANGDMARHTSLAAEVDTLTAQLAAAETAVAEIDARIAAAEAGRVACSNALSAASRRVERLRALDEALKREMAAFAAGDLNEADANSEAELAACEARLEAARAAVTAAHDQRLRAQTASAAAKEAAHRSEVAVTAIAAEQQTLKSLIAETQPAAGPTALDHLSAPPELSRAVAAAFGDDLLAPFDEDSTAHWRCLPPLEPAAASLPEGTTAIAELIGAPPPALARRLAATGLVADAETAIGLQPLLGPGQRLVTADGGLWRWDGFVQAAPSLGIAASLLAHRERLAVVTADHAAACAERDRALAVAAAAGELARVAETAERVARVDEREAESLARAARERVASAAAIAARRQAERTAFAQRQRQMEQQLSEALTETAAAKQAVATLPDVEALRIDAEPARRTLAQLRNAVIEHRTALAAHEREVEGRRRRAELLAREIADWQRRVSSAQQKIAETSARYDEAGDALGALRQRPALLKSRREELEAERSGYQRARHQAADDLAIAEATLDAADRTLRAADATAARAREETVRAEAALMQARHEQAQLAALIEERLGHGVAELDGVDTDDAEIDARRLERMRRERDQMGAVNLCAEAEEEALARKMEHLDAERKDLEAAIGKLRRAIAGIDGESRDRLLAAFGTIDGHFRTLFQRLFGGGRAELRLTDGDDPLVAGLEILASPPGKRLSLLSLLSGGEQALTAIALRFAVFLARPAPICVLDEVDAPLDDANVDRFCRLLDDLVGQGTRFLVITHHRLTMARMDRLYGVTMAEKGISRLLSVDLQRAEGLRHRA